MTCRIRYEKSHDVFCMLNNVQFVSMLGRMPRGRAVTIKLDWHRTNKSEHNSKPHCARVLVAVDTSRSTRDTRQSGCVAREITCIGVTIWWLTIDMSLPRMQGARGTWGIGGTGPSRCHSGTARSTPDNWRFPPHQTIRYSQVGGGSVAHFTAHAIVAHAKYLHTNN